MSRRNKPGRRQREEPAQEEEEEELDTFRRIVDERKAKRGKSELQVEWMDGTKSWVARADLEGQDALEEWDNQEPEEPEMWCSQRELQDKVAMVAQWLLQENNGQPRRQQRCVVFHVGAGMSAADGVPTFRGQGGLWTRGRQDLTNFDLACVQPGSQYGAMLTMERHGFVDAIVTQNYDNLFRKSGFPVEKLFEVHGNIMQEQCPDCGREYERTFPVEQEENDDGDHRTGRNCDDCGGELIENLVHFGEQLNHHDAASAISEQATISIAIGTKLMVTPACDWVFGPHHGRRSKKSRGKVVIVNTQATPMDSKADLVIRHTAAAFFDALLAALEIDSQ